MEIRAHAKSVLLVGTFISSSRHNHSVGEELAQRLAGRGWQVLMTSSATKRLPRLVDMVTTAWRRRGAYEVAQVDVYSGLAFGWAEAVCWTLRRARKPYLLALRGGNLPAFSERWPGRVRRLLASAAAVTAPSRYLLEQMAPYRSDLQLLPNPLEVQGYSFRPRARATPRLVWLRAFHEVYNPILAVEVVALLKQEIPEVHLTMVGPDKDGSLGRTQEAAGRLGVAEHLTFKAGVPHHEVSDWMQRGDIFLNTTNFDNTPVSVLEAMACGLCVVSTEVGGIPYLLEQERDALLVPPGDAQAMAGAVRRLLGGDDLAGRLSAQGRRKVEQFSWTTVLPQWEALLEALPQDFPLRIAP